MHPDKVSRDRLSKLTDLPNIGPAMARDLQRLGIEQPQQLADCDAMELYFRLCDISGVQQDPCVLDTFMSITAFMQGEAAQPWWAFTARRKKLLSALQKNQGA